MASPSKWGKKYTCFQCGCKFYDLNRGVALCPRCGTDQALASTREEEEDFEEEALDEDHLEMTEEEEEEAISDELDEELPEMEEDLGYDENDQQEEEP